MVSFDTNQLPQHLVAAERMVSLLGQFVPPRGEHAHAWWEMCNRVLLTVLSKYSATRKLLNCSTLMGLSMMAEKHTAQMLRIVPKII